MHHAEDISDIQPVTYPTIARPFLNFTATSFDFARYLQPFTMSRRRLSQGSIELSRFPLRPANLQDTTNVSFGSQTQGLLANAQEQNPTQDEPVGTTDTPGLSVTTVPAHPSRITTPSRQYPRFWHRISKLGLLMIPLGSLLLFGAIAFLCFSWLEPSKAKAGEKSHRLWEAIVFRDWITRAVTITAVLIRIVVTAQSAVITEMVAAIVIESSGVQLSQLPFLSMARAVAISPPALTMSLFSNRGASPSGSFYLALMITVSLLTLGSQFISTLLLTDFQDVKVAGLPNSTMVRMGSTASESLQLKQETWTRPVNTFWRFAEHHRPVQDTLPSTMKDTGATTRAALPWRDEKTRIELIFYNGMDSSWDARVVFFSPILEDISFFAENTLPILLGDTEDKLGLHVPTDHLYVEVMDSTTITHMPTGTVSRNYTTMTTFTSIETFTPPPGPINIQGSLTYDETYGPIKQMKTHIGPTVPFQGRRGFPFATWVLLSPWSPR